MYACPVAMYACRIYFTSSCQKIYFLVKKTTIRTLELYDLPLYKFCDKFSFNTENPKKTLKVLLSLLFCSRFLDVGLGVSGANIVSVSCARPSDSWISHLLTSSLSLGISVQFLVCFVVQPSVCESCRFLTFSLSSYRPSFISLIFNSRFLDS